MIADSPVQAANRRQRQARQASLLLSLPAVGDLHRVCTGLSITLIP